MKPLEKIMAIVPSALLLAANFLVFGPIMIYQGNASEFDTGMRSLLSLAGWFWLVSVVILSLPALLMSDRAVRIYVTICFCLAIGFWIQGNFLIGHHNVFDGTVIEWNQPIALKIGEAAVWGCVLGIGIWGAQWLARYASIISGSLLLAQTLMVGALSFNSSDIWTKTHVVQYRPPDALFAYSATQNVVHVILDSFQTDVFLELMEDETLRGAFDGFTVFAENIGVSTQTAPAIPALFSGRIYDGSEPFADYFNQSLENGLSSRLRDAGYRVSMVPAIKMDRAPVDTVFHDAGDFEQPEASQSLTQLRQLLSATLFRYVPHRAKQWLFSERRDKGPIVTVGAHRADGMREKRFFAEYTDRIWAADAQPAYHFIHLSPPHPPFVTLADGRYAGRVLPFSRDNYRNEARAILKLFAKLPARLRELGLFDSSLIVLQGDHGSSVGTVIDGEPVDLCAPRMPALLVVKPPGADGPLGVSTAPTSIADTPATILTTLGLDHELPGRSAFDIDERASRLRHYVRFPRIGGEAVIRRYVVNGSVFTPSSCRELEPTQIALGSNGVVPGQTINFGLLGDAEAFQESGWDKGSASSTWTWGDRSTLSFSLPPVVGRYVWHARVRPYLDAESVPRQRIGIWANGTRISDIVLDSAGINDISVPIPSRLLSGGTLELTLELPDAVPKQSTGAAAGGQARLALDFLSMRFSTAANIEVGESIEIRQESPGLSYLGTGWGTMGKDTIVSVGGSSFIHLPVSPSAVGAVLELDIGSYIKVPHVIAQRVEVRINSTMVKTWTGTTGAVRSMSVPLPTDSVRSGELNINLRYHDAVCPSCIGTGADSRMRAIDLHAIRLIQAE